MQLEVYPDYETLSQAAGSWLASIVREKPGASLVFAMGNTPQGAYHDIAVRIQRGKISLKQVRVFQLDEYLGVAADDRRSLYRWLREACLGPMDISPTQVVRLPGDAADPEAACKHFIAQLAKVGGLDVAILGLGPNGHLGFNEPSSDCNAPTRIVELTPESIASNNGPPTTNIPATCLQQASHVTVMTDSAAVQF